MTTVNFIDNLSWIFKGLQSNVLVTEKAWLGHIKLLKEMYEVNKKN